jgi:Carboxypeptidase regulatory-like domain/TonB dependent receptor
MNRKLFIIIGLAVIFSCKANAQSTFGTYLGTVTDPSGQMLVGATATLTNTGTGASTTVKTDKEGTYSFLNVEPGTYSISVSASGFQEKEYSGLVLQARDTQRIDVKLTVGSTVSTVLVQATGAVINTDVSNLAETRTGLELNTLPLAISSRASGSTSPFATLTSQAGVQTDSTGNISIAGAKPSLLNVTIDGISTMNVETSAPAAELFPSFNSIEEIRVSQNANAAEFGAISDITTVSKGGTNNPHGGVFDNYESAGFNAKSPFATTKPKLVMNDFGAYYSGPVMVPKLYNGKDKTFYFIDYEGLRLPQQSTVVQSVPSLAMRSGNLSSYSKQVNNVQGVPFAGNQIPMSAMSPTALAALKLLYPAPNFGAANAISNNYSHNFGTPIKSDQGDVRLDQTITSKQSVFVRYGYKQRSVETAPTASASNGGSALIGAFNLPEKDTSVTSSYTYAIRQNLLNELRFGLSKFITERTFNSNSGIVSQLGITGIPDLLSASVAAAPNFAITGFTATGGTGASKTSSRIIQILDDLTWTKQNHTVKAGIDYRYMNAFAGNVFGSSRLGKYSFNGSSAVGSKVGEPIAEFLLGVPDTTTVSDVLDADMNGYGSMYAYFIQDDWKVNSKLTLNVGLRYEFHPMMRDHEYNSANFDPDYTSYSGTQLVRGATVVPNQQALDKLTLPSFASGTAPIPIITAQQDNISSALVTVTKSDFAPRVGFAWRPFGNDRTVFRGGYGRFIATALGGNVVGGWAVSSSAVYVSAQSYSGTGAPVLSFPSPFQLGAAATGTLQFDYAITPHYRDPIVNQWNFTVERDLGFATGLRFTYSGSHGQGLNLLADLNQLPYNTVGYNNGAYATRPFASMSQILTVQNLAVSNYNAFTIEGNHRLTRGLQFQSSYTYARNLSDEGGGNPTGFVSEIGNAPSDRFHPSLDYGNVEYTRRNRGLGSFLYELPFGQGKRFLGNGNWLLNNTAGGWQMAGYMLFQSGPFLTPLANSSVDPTGTGITQTVGYARPDRMYSVSPYLKGAGAQNYLNSAAFAEPGQNIGRQGDASVGSLQGWGTESVSLSLIKNVKFTERVNVQAGAQVQNILNHRNLDVPASLVLGTSNFGEISSLQTKDNAGPRAISLTIRAAF